MAEHRSGSVHGNTDALSRCPGGEENFSDDCPFRYDNVLVNKVKHVENSNKVDMFAIDFRECQGWNNDSIARFQKKKMNICLFYLIGSDVVLDHYLKRLECPAKRFGIIGLSLEKSFSMILVRIKSMKTQ